MIFDIPINVSIEAATEEQAEQQLWEFLKYSKNHSGKEYGFVAWEAFQFLSEPEFTDEDYFV